MIYIFKVVGTEFVKLGFTQGNPWKRAATGFWSNVHPVECCGRLGWDNLELVALFEGTKWCETWIKESSFVKPYVGEFWLEDQLTALLRLCGGLCSSGPLPLPEKPSHPPEVERATEKLPCCGGPEFFCNSCSAGFKRAHHLRQHMQSCKGKKVACSGCSRKVIHRNLKRHQSACKAQAAAATSSQSD